MVSVGPPLGVDPAGKMRLRITNKQTNSCQNDIDKGSPISDRLGVIRAIVDSLNCQSINLLRIKQSWI